MTSKKIDNDRGFATLTGAETRVEWTARAGVQCVAERENTPTGSVWKLTTGPDRLRGREFANLRDLRSACND